MFFSIIIPVYNRPQELEELLESIALQSFRDFEVIVVEDGSSVTAEEVVSRFAPKIELQYFYQENTGQGFARNFGMRQAKGEFFVILDSDVLLPKEYLKIVYEGIFSRKLDAFGGPDAADSDFSDLQKAMDFAMTSFWTTGGIRGKLKDPSKYQARGYNMGVSKDVFLATQGFVDPNQGEDIEWSIRIKKSGFNLELIQEAFVYHKRKNTLVSFAKQAFSFGRNRVNVSRFHPEAIKLVHWMPSCFLVFILSLPVFALGYPFLFKVQLAFLASWILAVIFSAFSRYKSMQVVFLSLLASITQLLSYGLGLIYEWLRKIFRG
ncbi:glycosyltransferase [Algoriphagus mannitolivorans]|uniref:glycosyltransferase n=1 Tax=Algoriphagus mannitolivorans TaxID=226504 RepID=UPI000413C981|nr:glycosyltransferase [Algoriphagus mannitolivorans]